MRWVLFVAVLTACGGTTQGEANRAQVLWLKNLQGTNADGLRMVVGQDDGLMLAAFNQGEVDLGGGILGAVDTRALLLARYDENGAHLWSKSFAGSFGARLGLAVTGMGDVVLSIDSASVDLGGGVLGTAAANTTVPAGVLARFDGDDGTHLWSRVLVAGLNAVVPNDLVLDAEADIVIAGRAQQAYADDGTALETPGGERVFIGKFDGGDGALAWQSDGQQDDVGRAWRVAVDNDGDVLATASITPPVDPEAEEDTALVRETSAQALGMHARLAKMFGVKMQ